MRATTTTRTALLLLPVLGVGACTRDAPPDAPPDAPAAAASVAATTTARPPRPRVEVPDEAKRDPVAALKARLPEQDAYCAQVKSVADEATARGVAAEIEKAASAPVAVSSADLGARGTWWRICVGAEPSPGALVEKARRWTAPGGVLDPWMSSTAPGEARFLVQAVDAREHRAPTPEAALALLQLGPVDGAPIFVAAGPGAGPAGPLLVGTVGTPGAGDVVVLAADGREVPVEDGPPPGCASCAAALPPGSPASRLALATADVGPWAGEEVLVEETTGQGARVLSVLGFDDGGRLARRAGALLGKSEPGLLLAGEARVVEADGDAAREIAVVRRELPVVGDAACALRVRADVYDAAADGTLQKHDARSAAARADADGTGGRPGAAVLALVAALDGLEDFRSASRVCAAFLAQGRDPGVSQHCLGRVRSLAAQGLLVEAVSAGGLLAEAAPALRPAVAPPLFDAARALDLDPRLVAADQDCAGAPLLTGVSGRDLTQNMKFAAARQGERLNLADLEDAVFVTGARDFGADTPFGGLAARWLERLRVALPARHAAIEAALVPPPPAVVEPAPVDAAPRAVYGAPSSTGGAAR